jgi:hypothetical protein
LVKESEVRLSIGYRSSQSQGAANQTLLYVDNVRLLSYGNGSTGISTLAEPSAQSERLYNLQGRSIDDPASKGIYIKGKKKLMAK